MALSDEIRNKTGAIDEIDACARLVNKYFCERIDSSGPADLAAFAAKNNISISRDPNLQFEGCIERDAFGKALIRLRSGMNRRRERFTLAHELGHWMLQSETLGTCEGVLFRGVSRNRHELDEEERLANLLAAEMLLPRENLLADFDSGSLHRSLNHICRRYGVSRTVAVRRVADVCNVDLAFLQIMPYEFGDWRSVAQIDDAIFATARTATLFARESTKLCGHVVFGDLAQTTRYRLAVRSPRGLINQEFEILLRRDPAPHIYAIAIY